MPSLSGIIKQASRGADLYFVFRFLRLLTMDWKKTDAYKYKIIDAKGNALKKSSELESVNEKASYTMLHRMVFKIRRLIEKVPLIGKSILLNYAAALFLLKEQNDKQVWTDENHMERKLLKFLESDWEEEAGQLKEVFRGQYGLTQANEFLTERAMTDGEKKKREDIVLSMKKKSSELKSKYGDDWENIMYATATKQAMGESITADKGRNMKSFTEFQLDEISMEAGKVYHQDTNDGPLYFKAVEQQKNKRWKGLVLDIGKKKPKSGSADEKLRFWQATPDSDIPPSLKEAVQVDEGIRDFKLNDKVKFTNDDSEYFGETGKITALDGDGIKQKATVKLNKGGKSVSNILVKVDLIKENIEIQEGTALQVKMALDDVGITKVKWKNETVYVMKKDVEKAEKALKGNVIYKGKTPKVSGGLGGGRYVEEVEIDEGAKFSAAQLDKLKGEYSKIEKINPSSQSYKKMKEMLGKMSKEQLQQIKDAKIKFLQYTAGDLLRKMDEDVEIEEEVPTNSAGGGNVAGIGVGPQGEPGVHPKKKKKKPAWEDSRVLMNKFAGKDVFIVDSDMFHDCRMGKKKYHRYEKYVGTKRTGNAIREYGRKFPGRPIILQNGEDGPMLYLRYGRS